MRIHYLFAFAALAACGGGPTKQESQQLFAATTAAMTTARAHALASTPHAVPAAVSLDYQGPCSLGGAVAVTGAYDGASLQAVFDLRIAFSDCREVLGAVDGDLHWSAEISDANVRETISGSIDFASPNASASCDLDVALSAGTIGVSYSGSVCGYDAHVELGL